MNLSEKAAYLDGLTDGLGLKADGKMGAFWTSLNGLLGDMARQLDELKAAHGELEDVVDDLSSELDALEEYGFGMEPLDEDDDWEEDEDEDDGDDADVIRFNSRDGILKPGQKPSPYDDEELQDLYEDEEETAEERDDTSELLPLDKLSYNGVLYDVVCPNCGEEITIDEELLSQGSIVCPDCGELLEFDLSDEGEDEDETAGDEEEEPLEPIIPRQDPDRD